MTVETGALPQRANVVSNTLTIARRNLLHIRANPEQLFEMTIQPLMFLVLFVYVSAAPLPVRVVCTCNLLSPASSSRGSHSHRSPQRSA